MHGFRYQLCSTDTDPETDADAAQDTGFLEKWGHGHNRVQPQQGTQQK